MDTLFLTGFPGFLGSALAERLLARYPADVTLTCLIQPKFRKLAEARAAALEGGHPANKGRIRLVEGDITTSGLGLSGDAWEALEASVREVYHLAAVYDLAVRRDLGHRVNVVGTQHVLDLATVCPRLQRFQYVSTCYVSGRYAGTFTEDMLHVGQHFNNYYEETKYLAEVAVQEAMQKGLPATIYRPGITVGDSHTGATQKYDGPYYIIRWLLRWPGIAPLPLPGDPAQVLVNVIPRDYVIDAIDYLAAQPGTAGQVFQLSDPHPLTVAQMLEVLEKATERHALKIPISERLLVEALTRLPLVQRWTQLEPQVLPYFTQPTRYPCDHTLKALAPSGIACPPFAAYADRLIAFVKANPDISPAAMV